LRHASVSLSAPRDYLVCVMSQPRVMWITRGCDMTKHPGY